MPWLSGAGPEQLLPFLVGRCPRRCVVRVRGRTTVGARYCPTATPRTFADFLRTTTDALGDVSHTGYETVVNVVSSTGVHGQAQHVHLRHRQAAAVLQGPQGPGQGTPGSRPSSSGAVRALQELRTGRPRPARIGAAPFRGRRGSHEVTSSNLEISDVAAPAVRDRGQVGEVVGRHHLAPHRREIDLDLVPPRGVHLTTCVVCRSTKSIGIGVRTCPRDRKPPTLGIVGCLGHRSISAVNARTVDFRPPTDRVPKCWVVHES